MTHPTLKYSVFLKFSLKCFRLSSNLEDSSDKMHIRLFCCSCRKHYVYNSLLLLNLIFIFMLSIYNLILKIGVLGFWGFGVLGPGRL